MSQFGRSGLVGIGSVAAPLVIFFLLKFTIGLGPSASPAQVQGGETLPPPGIGSTPSAPTPEQKRALEWLASMKTEADLPSPLDHPKSRPRAVPVETPEAPEAPDPLAGVRLTALLSTGGGGCATINGRVCHVGDEVIKGYRLRTIDTHGQRVEVSGPDGVLHWLSREP